MKKLLSLIFISLPYFANAQIALDLKYCIERGLEKNYDIRIVKNTQQISDNNRSIGNAGFLPTLDLSAGYSGTLNNERNKLSDGGEIIEINNINNQQLNAGVSLNWTVFDGFNVQTNYSRLKELQQVGELNTRLSIENFIANISAEYYNYIQQTIRLKNLQSSMELSRERMRIVEARYSIGSMSRLDLQQAKVDFNTDSSRLMRQQEVLFASNIKLNQLMAFDNVEAPIVTADSLIVFDMLLNRADVWEEVTKGNTFLLLSEKDKRLSVIDLKTAQSKNYPYLQINAGYGVNQNRSDLSDYAYRNTLGLNYGVTLGFNLFNGFNRSREQKNARIMIENRALEYEQLVLSLRSDFSNIWKAYQNNMELIILEQESVRNATENYEIAMERYKLGNLSGIELREAQNSLLNAEERLLEAKYNTKLCEISLLLISGQIKQYLN